MLRTKCLHVSLPRRAYFPHPLALCCHYPVSKCRSASIAVTGTLRVNLCRSHPLWLPHFPHRNFYKLELSIK